ncbi:hypothetical protein Tco_0505730 [Tanacetum coccineum]
MGPSPVVTSKGISSKGHDCSPEKPTRRVFQFTQRDLIDEFSFKKQCSYITSHELPPSRYALFTCLPDMYTLIMTGSDEPTFERGGNVISPIPSCTSGLFFFSLLPLLPVLMEVAISCLILGPVGSKQPWRLFEGLSNFFYSEDLSRPFNQICPRLPNQDFVEPSSEEEMVPFIKDLGYTGKCDMLYEIHTYHMHHPWRTFAAVINRCISRKTTDFMFQADNRDISSARKENIPYLRLTEEMINHFISKDKTISMRAKINLHTIRDDTLLGTLKFISKSEDFMKYEALIPKEMINQDIKDSKAYKTYLAFATRQATPKKARKFKKIASPSRKLSRVLEEEPAKKP